jgi:hypothetical protein
MKITFIVFFDCHGLVHYEFNPRAKQRMQKSTENIMSVRSKAKRNDRNFGSIKATFFDNTPAHMARYV